MTSDMKKRIGVLAVAFALLSVGMVLTIPDFSVGANGDIEASRNINPDSVEPGDTFTVTVVVQANAGVTAPALDENVPAGWTVTPVTTPAGWTFNPSTLQWVLLGSMTTGQTATFVYEVTVPGGAAETTYSLSGQVSAYGVGPFAVTGETDVTVSTVIIPSEPWNYWSNPSHMYNENEGNIGIGTDTPTDKLHVKGNLRVESSTQTQLFFIDTNTNRIGVGTSAPSYGLDLYQKDIRINNPTGYNSLRVDIKGIQGRLGSDLGGFFLACDTNGKEVKLMVTQSGMLTHAIRLLGNSNGAVFNEGGRDRDLRVETTGNTHMLFVDASTNYVGIGTSNPQRPLHINDAMRLEPRATAPSSPAEGDLYYDSTSHMLKFYDGTTWRNCYTP